MFSRLLHPRARTLSDFVDGVLSPSGMHTVARHVAGCDRCREFVWSVRALDAAAQELPVPQLGAHVRERVLARRAAGEDIIVPVHGTEAGNVPVHGSTGGDVAVHGVGRSRSRRRFAPLAAAAALVAAVGIGIVVGTPRALGEASELIITPGAPAPGDTVRVEYHATSRLAGQPQLVLRARLRRPTSAMDAEHAVLATLERRSERTFSGAFVLPHDVVYAVLAVEDARAADVDHNGERWEVLLHDADGVPAMAALQQQFRDLHTRDVLRAQAVAARMLELAPHSIRSWFDTYLAESATADREQLEALKHAHHARLRSLLDDGLPSRREDLADAIFYAMAVNDTATVQAAREQLLARFPESEAAQQQRVFMAAASRTGDRAAFWAELERIWEAAPPDSRHAQIAATGFMTAQQWRDADALRRWGGRLATTSGDSARIGQTFLDVPELRDEGIRYLDAHLRSFDPDEMRQRSLTHSADEFATMRNRWLGGMMAQFGKALIAAGREAEGASHLNRALELTWDVGLFRRVAQTRMEAGDTTAALPLLARVAVDPATPPAFADSTAAWVADDAAWDTLRADAYRTMQRHVMALATNRPVRGRPRLTTADGSTTTFEAAHDAPTFVAMWSRYCPPSAMQLSELAALMRQLRQQGVRVLAITDEAPSAALSAYLSQRELDLPVFHDANLEARRAFDSFGTPSYIVMDAQGRIRFQSHGLTDVRRQVALLQNGPAAVQQRP